jgi:hypothetical protein
LSVFLSVLCLLVRGAMVDKSDLYASINARVTSLLINLEGWVPWDDAIVVSAGKPRKTVGFRVNCAVLRERL